MSYFGFKMLEWSYLLKVNENKILERPQKMWMRVTWEIHRTKPRTDDDNKGLQTKERTHRKVEDANLMAQILWQCVRNGNVRYDEYGIFHTVMQFFPFEDE